MSLLDGLNDALINPMFESINESEIDDNLDFEFALEATVDKCIELSDADINAILDDENPDNVVSDLSDKDNQDGIDDSEIDDELKVLESALNELFAMESDETPEDVNPSDEPESMEGCSDCKALEMDDNDDDEGNEDEENDDYVSIDSLLDTVFK